MSIEILNPARVISPDSFHPLELSALRISKICFVWPQDELVIPLLRACFLNSITAVNAVQPRGFIKLLSGYMQVINTWLLYTITRVMW